MRRAYHQTHRGLKKEFTKFALNADGILCSFREKKMTAQINDSVFHRQKQYSIAGVSGIGLFEPAKHGLSLKPTCSACWRGYVADYAVIDGAFILIRLTLALSDQDAKAHEVHKAFGKYHGKKRMIGWEYSGLKEPIPFSGGLLLGEGFIRELYVHMGFHPAWKYRDVREVIFEKGKLIDEFDRSDLMETARAKRLQKPIEPTASASPNDVSRWIERTFSRDYNK